MLRVLNRLDDAVSRIEFHILWALLAIVASVLLIAVFFRYIVASPFVWSEELVTTLFTWMVFVGASACFATHQHIRVDTLPRLAPPFLRVLLGIVSVLICFIVLAVCIYYGIAYAQRVWGDRTPIMGLSFASVALALPVTSACAILHVLRTILAEGPDRALMSTMEMVEDNPEAPI